MADNTKIEWTDATWNPVTGCSVVSPGCTNCYAMKLAGTRLRHHPSRAGLTVDTKAGPVWTGEVRLNEGWLDQPLRWRRPRRIFVCAHGDLFHELVPEAWIDRVFAVMALAPQHTFQVLTKRSRRMRDYLRGINQDQYLGINRFGVAALATGLRGPAGSLPSWPLPNVWLGVSVEDQARADQRIPDLLATPASVRFVSAEPLLGAIDLTAIRRTRADGFMRPLDGRFRRIDWVIAGGESGPGARPMHPNWPRSLRDQCQAAGVPFFFKQWGEWEPIGPMGSSTCSDMLSTISGDNIAGILADGRLVERGCEEAADWIVHRVGKSRAGRILDGREWSEMPR